MRHVSLRPAVALPVYHDKQISSLARVVGGFALFLPGLQTLRTFSHTIRYDTIVCI